MPITVDENGKVHIDVLSRMQRLDLRKNLTGPVTEPYFSNLDSFEMTDELKEKLKDSMWAADYLPDWYYEKRGWEGLSA